MDSALRRSVYYAEPKRLLHRMISAVSHPAAWLGRAFRTPPGINNPTETVGPRALYGLFIAMLVSAFFLLAVQLPFFAVRKVGSALFSATLLLAVLTSFVILRRGRFRLAAWVLLSTAWLLTTYMVVLSGGIYSPGVLGYLTIVVAAAWI